MISVMRFTTPNGFKITNNSFVLDMRVFKLKIKPL